MPKVDYTKNELAIMKTWKNAIKVTPEGIISHPEKVYKYITSKYSNNTLKTHIIILCSILRKNGKDNKQREKWMEQATKINKDMEKVAINQQIAPNRAEHQISWSKIIEARGKIKKLFEEDKTNNKNNEAYLAAALYTMRPPIRLDYADMELIDDINDDVDSKQNYILQNKKKGTYTIIINHDKVIETHKKGIYPIKEPELNKIIANSLKEYKRDYLFSKFDSNEEPLGKIGLRELLHYVFKPKLISVDILRSAYISEKYPKISLAEKMVIANQMRHSPQIAELAYQKVGLLKCPNCGFKLN